LRLLFGEGGERPDLDGVAVHGRAGLIEHERQDELLDEAEEIEIAVAANLIEQELLARIEGGDAGDARERLGKEGFGEVELLVAADEILHLPVDLERIIERRFVAVAVGVHASSLFRAEWMSAARLGQARRRGNRNYRWLIRKINPRAIAIRLASRRH